ncbi:MAG: SDR family NAD(P)-dependent oxidoreductase [Alkalispirochaetaceae bacterium]
MGLLRHVDHSDRPLVGRRALVIGGSGGIGRQVSVQLAEAGANLVVHGGSNRERLTELLEAVRKKGVRAEGFLQSVRHSDELLDSVRRRMPFDIAVVAFGPYLQKSLAETTAADWRRMVDLNLILPGSLVSLLAPVMAANGWGRIVLFGGTRTEQIRGFRSIAAYSAAKTGVGSLVRSAAKEFGDRGVAINAVAPGYVQTEYLSAAEIRRLAMKSPDRTLIPPSSLAQFVLNLILQRSTIVNGAVIPADKGL